MKCICEQLQTIDEFHSIDEFRQFKEWLQERIDNGSLSEVPAKKTLSIVEFDEQWFQCVAGHTWRLVAPDFPFKGVFRKVS